MNSRTSGHAHHITPLKTYLGVGAALLFLTLVTTIVAQIQLGSWNVVVALAIAAIKASLVAFFFMHLYYDNKLYFIVFTIGILFLAIFIGFTMLDTEERGDLYEEVAHPINAKAAMYDSLSQTAAPHGHEAADSTAAPVDSAAAESEH
jgi:cytochrome c oxidase subunit 4